MWSFCAMNTEFISGYFSTKEKVTKQKQQLKKKKLIRKNYNLEDSVSNFSVLMHSTFKSAEDYKSSEESNRRWRERAKYCAEDMTEQENN